MAVRSATLGDREFQAHHQRLKRECYDVSGPPHSTMLLVAIICCRGRDRDFVGPWALGLAAELLFNAGWLLIRRPVLRAQGRAAEFTLSLSFIKTDDNAAGCIQVVCAQPFFVRFTSAAAVLFAGLL